MNNFDLFFYKYKNIHYYIDILLYFFIGAIVFCFILVIATYIIAPRNNYNEKINIFECGFDSFHDSKKNLDTNFQYIAILFLIFDLELAFFLPIIMNYKNIIIFLDFESYLLILFFFYLLIVAFLVELIEILK